MNRDTMGMSASPFQKMTYESATRFLGEAITYPSALEVKKKRKEMRNGK